MSFIKLFSSLMGRKNPPETAGMQFPDGSPYALRHHLEYDMLPMLFFPSDLSSSERLFRFWQSVYEKKQADFPYHPDDFEIEMKTSGDGTRLARIELPQPEMPGLCWRIYCLLNTSERLLLSFAFEKTEKKGKTAVVAIRADGRKIPLGLFPLYTSGNKDYSSMMSAEAVMVLNLIQKTM